MRYTTLRSFGSLRCIRVGTARLAANDEGPFAVHSWRASEVSAQVRPSGPQATSDELMRAVVSWLVCELMLQRSALHFRLCDQAMTACLHIARATLSWDGPHGRRSAAVSPHRGLPGTQGVFGLPPGTRITAQLHLQGCHPVAVRFVLPPSRPHCAC